MKKALTSIVLIAVILTSIFVFTACDKSTVQGQLENIWLSSETFTYSVTDNSGETPVTGTYVIKINKQNGGDLPFGSATLKNAPAGYTVSGELKIGTDTVNTGCYYRIVSGTKYMAPHATFRNQTINGQTFVMDGTFSGSSLNYTLKKGTENQVTGSVSAREPFYDNNEIHQMLRSISTFSQSLNFSFNVPVVAENEITTANLNAKVVGSENIKTPYTESVETLKEKGIACYKVALGRNTEVIGASHTIYISNSDVKVNGWNLRHVITKIVEPTKINGKTGNVIYTLINIEI